MIAFDTLELVRELEVAGFPPNQAEAQTRVLVKLLQRVDDARQDQLATRQEVVSLDTKMELRITELKRDIKELDTRIETTKAELKRDLKDLDGKIEIAKVELKRDIEAAKVDSLKWTAGMFAAQTALIIGAMFAMVKMNQPSAPPVPYHAPTSQETRLPPVPVPPGR